MRVLESCNELYLTLEAVSTGGLSWVEGDDAFTASMLPNLAARSGLRRGRGGKRDRARRHRSGYLSCRLAVAGRLTRACQQAPRLVEMRQVDHPPVQL